jgi:hypothetical protein
VNWLLSILPVVHLVGLALGVGCATAKLTLLARSKSDPVLIQAFLAVARPITKLIILGLVLLTISGIVWLVSGYSFTSLLVIKLVMVAVIWVLGPVIDNVVEPRFVKLAPKPGDPVSQEFLRARRDYLIVETAATSLFYIIIAVWLLA